MLGIGGTELVIILVFGFLLFGPDRLPAMGRTIGRALRQFRQAQDQMNKMVKTEIYDPLNAAAKEPAKKQGPKKKVSGKSAAAKPETFAEKKARLTAEAEAASQRKAAGISETAAPAAPAKPAGTSETFAQRKARLEAEKAAAEAKKAAGTGTSAAKPKTTSKKTSSSSAAKLYGIDKDRIAAARAAAAQKTTGKEDQADA